MKSTMRNDFRTIWFVRSRTLRSDLGYWLDLLGYNAKTSRIEDPLYMVYAILFFAVWIFMVLTLLAKYAATMLAALPFGSAALASVGAAVLALAGLFILELFQSTRRSPFSFSEEDANLLCQTPLDRRPVALFWFLDAWLKRGLLVWAGMVVIAYALVEAQAGRPLTPSDLPMYLLAGVRMFSTSVPLYLLVLSLAWAAGAWRLHGRFEPVSLRWTSPALSLLLVSGLVLVGPQNLLNWLLPLTFPVLAGLGLAAWPVGFILALLAGFAGLVVLWTASRAISLARAAQESLHRQAIQAASFTGQQDLVDELVQKQRMRDEHSPSRLPAGRGAAALIWKNIIQTGRRFKFPDLFSWLGLTVLVLFLLLADLGARGWSLAILLVWGGPQMVRPLRRELSRWWLFRQLPFGSLNLVTGMLLLPTLRFWLAGLCALLAVLLLGKSPSPAGIWLFLISAPAMGLAAAVDVLRRSKTQDLLAGRIPEVGLVGFLLELVVVILNGGFAWVLLYRFALPEAGVLPWIVMESLVVLYVLWKWAGDTLRQIK